MGRVRLHELAERHGVSVSTASRALSGKPGVSPELRRNLVEAAREVGYPLPGSLQGKAVLVAASRAAITDYDRNLFTAQVLAGMRERASALGLELRTITLRDGEPEALDGDAGRGPARPPSSCSPSTSPRFWRSFMPPGCPPCW